MKRDSDVRITVSALDDDGAGMGDGVDVDIGDAIQATSTSMSPVAPIAVCVAGALPGEDVTARVDALSMHRPLAWASLRTIHRASPDRATPACRAYGRCGGCVMQHLDVRGQLAWKEARLRRQLDAYPSLAATVPVNPVVASPLSLGYRNNSKLVAASDGDGRLVLGAFAPRSHDVIDLAGCAVTEPALGVVSEALTDLLRVAGVEPYNESRLVGLLRHVILRANARGQVLVTLVTAGDAFPGGAAIAQALRARHPHVVGIVQNVNPSRGNAIYGDRERTLAGEPTIDDQIGNVRLRISSRAFFQANRGVAALAYDAIARAVAPTRTDDIVDAYAGVGGIALTLAPAAKSVLGIEEHAAAVHGATISADLNLTVNARFVAGDVADVLRDVQCADVVVLNPPRKGCATEVLARVAALRPRTIAYLSCAPTTLLRDLDALATLGYATMDLTPFDMLPHTIHLEVLAILVRRAH